MRFHVLSLPHTQTTNEFLACAYTQKVVKFCNMMHARGHEVYLYSGSKNTAKCTEHIPCVTEAMRKKAVGKRHYTEAMGDPTQDEIWIEFNHRATIGIAKRHQQKDFICSVAGVGNKQIINALS